MGVMRNVRDTFLMCLHDNIGTYTLHNVRYDKQDSQANVPMLNAVNVTFTNADFAVTAVSEHILTIDVMWDDEFAAIDAAETVANVLKATSSIPLMDYSGDPPVQVLNSRVMWNPNSVKFRPVKVDDYFHLSCLIHLQLQYS